MICDMVRWYDIWYGMMICGMVYDDMWCGMMICDMVRWYDIWYGMMICDMIWWYVVWYDDMWCGMMICDMVRLYDIWYGMTICDMVWWYVTWYDDMWCGMMICDTIRYDMVWYDIWYGMIYDICSDIMWYAVIRYDMIWHHHQFCRTVPRTARHLTRSFHIAQPLQSKHFAFFTFLSLFSDLLLTLSKCLSHSFTLFYFSTLLLYHFCTVSALCTAHIHSILQLLVSGQLDSTRQPIAQHGQLFELILCHLLFILRLLLAPGLYHSIMSSTTFGTICCYSAYFVTTIVKYLAHNFAACLVSTSISKAYTHKHTRTRARTHTVQIAKAMERNCRDPTWYSIAVFPAGTEENHENLSQGDGWRGRHLKADPWKESSSSAGWLYRDVGRRASVHWVPSVSLTAFYLLLTFMFAGSQPWQSADSFSVEFIPLGTSY